MKEQGTKAEELGEDDKNQLWHSQLKEATLKVINKPLGDLQKDEVKAPWLCHGVGKTASSKKTVGQTRNKFCQLKTVEKVDLPEHDKQMDKDG